MPDKTTQKEKKVEYLELIYDLIFVYVIGRNSLPLHRLTNGFLLGEQFLTYILCTLTVIQIWSFSTYYINMHGRNGVRDHVFICVNMFLLYFVGRGIRPGYRFFLPQYHIAWGLILLNIGIQYLIERRNHTDEPEIARQTVHRAAVLITEAALVFLSMPLQQKTGVYMAPAAILFGTVATTIHGKRAQVLLVDFPHLTERAMLYVIFTFGEMVVALAGYFDGGFDLNTVYFALMAFLIVVGLFLSYETVYNHLIDRERQSSGLGYMLLHILLIFALSTITTALEFMQIESVALIPKMLMLLAAFMLYFASLLGTLRYSKDGCRPNRGFLTAMAAAAVCFVILMLCLRNRMDLNIALTVLYVFGVFLMLYRLGKSRHAV